MLTLLFACLRRSFVRSFVCSFVRFVVIVRRSSFCLRSSQSSKPSRAFSARTHAMEDKPRRRHVLTDNDEQPSSGAEQTYMPRSTQVGGPHSQNPFDGPKTVWRLFSRSFSIRGHFDPTLLLLVDELQVTAIQHFSFLLTSCRSLRSNTCHSSAQVAFNSDVGTRQPSTIFSDCCYTT